MDASAETGAWAAVPVKKSTKQQNRDIKSVEKEEI